MKVAFPPVSPNMRGIISNPKAGAVSYSQAGLAKSTANLNAARDTFSELEHHQPQGETGKQLINSAQSFYKQGVAYLTGIHNAK